MRPSSSVLPAGWRWTTVGELKARGSYSLVGGPFGSSLTRGDYVEVPGVPVIRGTNLGGDTGDFIDSDFVYVSEEKADALFRNLAFAGDIIFTQRGTLGQVSVIPNDATFPRYVVSQSQMKLTLDESRADARYIFHYFRSPVAQAKLQSRALVTGVPHINLSILKELPVLLPPLPEQRRIAAILDKAGAIRRKRQQAIQLTEDLLRSVFLDMFGDPVTNPKGWPAARLGSLGLVQGGLQVTSSRHSLPIEVPYLRVANVFSDSLDLSEVKTIRVSQGELRRAALEEGDILIVEGHGNRSEIGRAATWDGSIEPCVHQNHLIRVRIDRRMAQPGFVSAFLNSAGGRRQLTSFGKTTSGLNTISTSNVKSMCILLPPIAVQRRWSEIVGKHRVCAAAHRVASATLEELQSSLVEALF